MPRFRFPSPAMCVALLGLTVALGGTAWAATALPARSVGTLQLKPNAVTGDKVANHSLTSADLDLSKLGAVPSALHAKSANLATGAEFADRASIATRAYTADVAGAAYSTHFETAVALPPALGTVATLVVPAGNWVLDAKGQVDTFNASDIVECDLVANLATDRSFVQGGVAHASQIMANSLVFSYPSATLVHLVCMAVGAGNLSNVRVTAIQVAGLSNTP
jgi:hypothetical protein